MPVAKREEFQALLRMIADVPPKPVNKPGTTEPAPRPTRPRQAYQLDALDERILDALIEHGPSLTGEIAEEIGKESRGLNMRLGALEKRHLVTGVTRKFGSTTRKEWTITDEGRRAAVTPNPEVWQNPA